MINRPVQMSVFMFDKRSRLTDYFVNRLIPGLTSK